MESWILRGGFIGLSIDYVLKTLMIPYGAMPAAVVADYGDSSSLYMRKR